MSNGAWRKNAPADPVVQELRVCTFCWCSFRFRHVLSSAMQPNADCDYSGLDNIKRNGCATGSSERWPTVVCPPVVEYSCEKQRRVAHDVAALPESSVIVDWFADYAMLRG